MYLINKYISLSDICLTVHHSYKQYRQPTRCNNNGILIIPVSSTCFRQLFCPSSGTLDCVLPAGGRQHRWVHYTTICNTQYSVPEDGQNNCPKHVELTRIINNPLLLHLVGCLYYSYFIIFFRPTKQFQFIPLQNVMYFITLPFMVRKIFKFHINYVLLFKCPIPGPKG